jgi:hypothetical protein
MNAAKSYVDVSRITVYPDASGAPATVRIADYVFACDMLGEARLNCIKPGHGSRVESKIAAKRAEAAYTAAVMAQAGDEWLAKNAAMYAQAA